MQLPIDVWQGYSGYWQSAFIRENLLPLGHTAWQGHLAHGRGLVACEVELWDASTIDWSSDVVQYSLQYMPAVAVPAYCQLYHLSANGIQRLMGAVQTYSPDREIVLSIRGDGPIELDWLRNLAIAPPDCYRQVHNRWDEFKLGPGLSWRCDDAQP